LRWKEVDLDVGTIAVYRAVRATADTRTPKSRRVLSLPRLAVQALRELVMASTSRPGITPVEEHHSAGRQHGERGGDHGPPPGRRPARLAGTGRGDGQRSRRSRPAGRQGRRGLPRAGGGGRRRGPNGPGIATFTVIRIRNNPHREGRKSRFFGSHARAAWVVLGMIFLVIATRLLYRGAQINTGVFPQAHGAFASQEVGHWLHPFGTGVNSVLEVVFLLAQLGVADWGRLVRWSRDLGP
jgi:hypothetical protein